MATRKRSGSGSKRQLKEKVVQIYESFFRGENLASSDPMFWDEFFLLKPKLGPLEAEIHKMSSEQIINMKDNINMLFNHCIDTLGQEHHIRVVYALQTLSAITYAVYQKLAQHPCLPNILGILTGVNNVENKMQKLLLHCNKYLSGDVPDSLKSLVLKFLLVLVTGMDDISNNVLLEYLMVNSMFESLIQLLSSSVEREQHGHDVVVLLTLLVNYRKQESANPYIVKLSILDDELALNGYGQVIRSALGAFTGQVAGENMAVVPSPGWLSSFTSLVGGMFLAGDDANTAMQRSTRIRANNAVLLALYEAAHLNRNFMTTLAHASARASAPPSPPATLPPHQCPPNAAQLQLLDHEQPTNLLVTFFQYCSIVMQDTKTECSMNTCKLCFVILTCVSEDQYANSIMHDVNLTFKVQLHRLPMRHRKLSPEKELLSQTLAATLIDLLVEFIMSHLMKKFPLELYVWCVGVIHRLLCYQKRCRVRINYPWKELWSAMISLLKFLVAHESNLTKKVNIFHIALQIVNIFNLFIMYGDTFLPTPGSYDQLYYELIRMNQVFDNLYYMALRYSTSESEYKEKALRLANCLINVRAIINHFTPKIDGWLASQSLSTPTEDQILEVVKKNYDSLTLKLQESLDVYERYSERPFHTEFFQIMVKNMVIDTRLQVNYAAMDLQAILQECSTIH